MLAKYYRTMSKPTLAAKLRRTVTSIKSRAAKLRIVQDNRWTEADRAQLIQLYPDTDTTTLARLFGRTEKGIHQQAKTLGLHKSAAFLRQLALDQTATRQRLGHKAGQFRPGQTPWNKGKKGWSAPGTERTQFCKGHRPHSWQPIGTEVIREGGLLYRKVRDEGPAHKHFKAVHVLVWEAANGPVPPGHAVVFRDRLPKHLNITLDRLELVTRAKLMRRNSYHNLPKDIRGAITMKARLTRVINEKLKTLETDQ